MIKVHLSRIMGEKRLKVSDVARMTGLHRNAISRLYKEESGGIQWDTLERLCKALDCTVADLIEYIPDDQDDK